VYLFAPLHDLGKITIPDAVLLKPGQLDAEETTVMRAHSRAGLELVDQLLGNFGLAGVSQVQMLRNIILHHHELVDGSGYPDGLIAEQIPLESRIVTVADVFDALTSERPYKQPWSNAEAFAFLQQQAGLKFDRDCVTALLNQVDDIEHIQQRFCENAYG
jgi:response regulator RpfG family c-di-GMP phosphodiesterase